MKTYNQQFHKNFNFFSSGKFCYNESKQKFEIEKYMLQEFIILFFLQFYCYVYYFQSALATVENVAKYDH